MDPRALRLITEFYTTPWALRRETLAIAQLLVHRWASGVRLSADEIRAAVGGAPAASAARRQEEARAGGNLIAVLPVFGVIGHRAHLVEDVSSGVNTSTELLARAFRELINDPAVGAIVFDHDSPGGSVFGVAELASEIFAARGRKPMTSVVNSLSASASYWLASAADEVVITPGGVAGSIGVWSAHEDWSKYFENEGVKVTLISAGKYKVEGNLYEPLGEEARTAVQSDVDKYYAMFVESVAMHRGDRPSAVRAGYGEGRVLLAKDAVETKLADRIATFDQVIAELRTKLGKQNPSQRVEAPRRAAAERELRMLDAQ